MTINRLNIEDWHFSMTSLIKKLAFSLSDLLVFQIATISLIYLYWTWSPLVGGSDIIVTSSVTHILIIVKCIATAMFLTTQVRQLLSRVQTLWRITGPATVSATFFGAEMYSDLAPSVAFVDRVPALMLRLLSLDYLYLIPLLALCALSCRSSKMVMCVIALAASTVIHDASGVASSTFDEPWNMLSMFGMLGVSGVFALIGVVFLLWWGLDRPISEKDRDSTILRGSFAFWLVVASLLNLGMSLTLE